MHIIKVEKYPVIFKTNHMKEIILSLLISVAMSGVSGQGTYIEFKITSEQGGANGTTKTYTQSGNSRTEMNMADSQPASAISNVMIMLQEDPHKMYVLNEKQKTYSEINTGNKAPPESTPSDYQVTVIGKEKANGYNCTHVKIRKRTSETEEDMWVSADVPNYKLFENSGSKYASVGLFKALLARGVMGFPVRALATEKGGHIQIDLVKAEARNNPAGLFSLSGYTKEVSKSGATSADAQETLRKLQEMTPEERQKMIEQLRKQSATPH
jgi:hypothetical protein